MPYMDPFKDIIQTTKRNNIYYGPTESEKMASFLSEVRADLDVLFDEVNSVRASFDALASGYFLSSTDPEKLDYIRRSITDLSEQVNQRIYIQAIQPSVL